MNKFTQAAVPFIMFFVPVFASASAHILNYENLTDQCQPMDPNCIQKVSDLCYRSTTLGYEACYQHVLQGKGCQTPGFAECVKSTSQYCYDHTTIDSSHCFEQAVNTCKGK
jgi:hypothetical protein